MSISRKQWATILFWVMVVVAVLVIWQQTVFGSGMDTMGNLLSALIPMLFPVGLAYWGMKTGMVGPAIGGFAMTLLLWATLRLGQ